LSIIRTSLLPHLYGGSVTFNALLLSSFPKGGADEPRPYPDGDSMRDTESGATSENSVIAKFGLPHRPAPEGLTYGDHNTGRYYQCLMYVGL
jgi:hypothetical protein